MSHDFFSCVLACLTFDLRPLSSVSIHLIINWIFLGCVCSKDVVVDNRSLIDALSAWMRVPSFSVLICFMRGMCPAVIRDSFVHSVSLDFGEMGSSDKMQVGRGCVARDYYMQCVQCFWKSWSLFPIVDNSTITQSPGRKIAVLQKRHQ